MMTLLIIEDEQTIRENLAMMLEFEGYTVLQAETAEEGFQLAEAHLPEMILCDMMLPGMDGLTFYERIRSTPSLQAVPFVLMTARVDVVSQGNFPHQIAYLVKPFSPGELFQVVKDTLS